MPARAAVACGHPVTAAAAAEVLEDGGNAFDAVLAALFAACVAEPVLASLGGGGYLLAQSQAGKPLVYDFFVQTPLRKPDLARLDFHAIHADFGTTRQEFHIGLGAVATPGAVRGAFAIHRDLCTLPMTRLVEPAVRAAREGVCVNRLQSFIFDIIRPIYLATPEARQTYASRSRPDSLSTEGETLIQKALADTLEALARDGDSLFYDGEIGRRIVKLCGDGGGLLGVEDLECYRVECRQALSVDYRGARLSTNPPPSSGGILIAFALRLLESRDVQALAFGSAAHLGLLADVMELTNKARVDSQAGAGTLAGGGILDPSYLQRYRKEILGRSACPRGTTHISVIDAAENVAAMTLSNGEGCGHLIPDTGVMLNNMLGEEDVNPQGFHRWQPGQRMSSMMAPSLLRLADGQRIALGSGGSNRIRSAMLQVISNLVDFAMPLQQAVDSPRIHSERGHLNVEPGYLEPDLRALLAANPDHTTWDSLNLFFGGVHAVALNDRSFTAAGDPRRGGLGMVLKQA
ncbi:MAG: gamma-glutamyltransferase [Sterolibacteriaceae bacterium]|uniref:Glutathione hydrolase proenzyme n=1 Tax=Candidatus Methylophosphatis roskildensis TaxID=2899263 RepID=A0A9D7HN33_9PROT|nr:gamma-glutamyltransferase [Candidatus Methylophosphatis roskildensis]